MGSPSLSSSTSSGPSLSSPASRSKPGSSPSRCKCPWSAHDLRPLPEASTLAPRSCCTPCTCSLAAFAAAFAALATARGEGWSRLTAFAAASYAAGPRTSAALPAHRAAKACTSRRYGSPRNGGTRRRTRWGGSSAGSGCLRHCTALQSGAVSSGGRGRLAKTGAGGCNVGPAERGLQDGSFGQLFARHCFTLACWAFSRACSSHHSSSSARRLQIFCKVACLRKRKRSGSSFCIPRSGTSTEMAPASSSTTTQAAPLASPPPAGNAEATPSWGLEKRRKQDSQTAAALYRNATSCRQRAYSSAVSRGWSFRRASGTSAAASASASHAAAAATSPSASAAPDARCLAASCRSP
mmetsp:Transcript_42088/g.117189  ORF Transcript_42088/g.117189 Transcript_42088/m.117189 type:complete len:353 (-) Transcript_42088:1173-2231(-)